MTSLPFVAPRGFTLPSTKAGRCFDVATAPWCHIRLSSSCDRPEFDLESPDKNLTFHLGDLSHAFGFATNFRRG